MANAGNGNSDGWNYRPSPSVGKINNAAAQLPFATKGKTWATLSTIDGKDRYEFLVNPETIIWSRELDLASLAVAGTNNPLRRPKTSSRTLKIPEFLLISPANDRDLTGILNRLDGWQQFPAEGKAFPLLKFYWGEQKLDRCYLSRLEYTVLMSRAGRPTYVKGSMDLLPAPETPKIRTEAIDGEIMSDRERADVKTGLIQQIKSSKELMSEFGITAESNLEIDKNDDVYVVTGKDRKKIGTAKELTERLKVKNPTQPQK